AARLQGGHQPPARPALPLLSELLELHDGGDRALRRAARGLAGRQAHRQVPPAAPRRAGPRAGHLEQEGTRMKPLPIILALVFSLMFPLPAAASDAASVQVPESLAQGDLVMGRTQPGSEVVYGDRSLRVDAQGHFVFGLGRDEAGPVSLLVKLPDGR